VNTLGDMTVNSSTIFLVSRSPGSVLGFGGLTETDTGLDFVVGGFYNFLTSPVGGPATFAGVDGSRQIPQLFGYPFQAYGPVEANTLELGGQILDLKASGPSNTNIASAIAAAVPREETEVPTAASFSEALKRALERLGIFARDPSPNERVDSLGGTVAYDDTQRGLRSGGAAFQVVTRRLSGTIALDAVERYKSLFWEDVMDPETGATEKSLAQNIRSSFEDSLSSYMKANNITQKSEVDGVAWREFVKAAPDMAEAEKLASDLQELFALIGQLGLTPEEFRVSKTTLMKNIMPGGVRFAQMERFIHGGTDDEVEP